MKTGFTNNIIVDKSKAFAIRIVKMYRYLCDEKREYVLSKRYVVRANRISRLK